MPKGGYDWSVIIEWAKELIEHADSVGALCSAVSARIGKTIPISSFRTGMRTHLEVDASDIATLRMALRGEEGDMSPLATQLLQHIKRSGRNKAQSLLELSELFDRSPKSVLAAATSLRDDHDYSIEITDDQHLLMPSVLPPSLTRIPVEVWTKPSRVYRWGVLSDTHLANRKARLDVLEAAYDIYEAEGIDTVLHLGNMIDGEFRWNRSELLVHGVEGQLAYAAKHYPKREGITTKFLSADCHEGWWARDIGLDIGRHMHNTFRDNDRGDLQWIGHVQRDLELHPDNPQAVLRLFHPGGGSAYALSYPIQKHVESWQGGEKPAIAFFGHYHKYDANYVREIFCLQAGTTCDQVLFMRKNKLAAHVGVCIVEVHMSEMGSVGRVKHEWIPFYNKGYYESWDYASMFS